MNNRKASYHERKKNSQQKKGKKLIRFIKVLLVAALICGATGGIAAAAINIAVKNTAKNRIITPSEAAELQSIDCIIVLGCQVKSGGIPSPMLQDRIDCGVELYKLGVSPVLLVSGDSRSSHYDEVGTMKRVAEERGIPAEAIECDGYGLSTYDSIYRTAKLLGYKKIVVVTQEYHLYRAIYIAQQLGLEAYGVAADTREYRNQWQRDIREVAARVKDFAFCLFGANAEMGLSVWNPAPQ